MTKKSRISNGKVHTNGKSQSRFNEKQQDEFFQFMRRIQANQELSRVALAQRLVGGGHQLDDACGYPQEVNFEQCKYMIDREGIAAKVNSIFPDACFSQKPYVYETQAMDKEAQTPFEIAWKDLTESYPVLTKLNTLDVVSGIGQYGAMVIGTDDGRDLSFPFPGINERGEITEEIKEHKLTYLMPFNESEARISKMQTKGPRNGRPLEYNITIANPQVVGMSVGKTQKVHWSRVIHVAEGCTSSDIIAPPRLKKSFNYILNIRKIMGGSAEMFYMGGFPGTSWEVPPELAIKGELDKEELSRQMDEYYAGFRRWFATSGLHAEQLYPNIADPTSHFNMQMLGIAITMGVPLRILMGSEEARLASMNDLESWNRQVHRRNDIHVTPNLLRQTIDRFLSMGILPQTKSGKYFVEWPDTFSVSESARADITGKLVRALAEYVKTGAFKIFPPLEFFTRFMDMTTEEAEEVITKLKETESSKEFAFLDELVQKPASQGEKTASGKPGTKSPRRRKPLGSKNKVKIGANEYTVNPLMRCKSDGSPGFKYGEGGRCYIYTPGNKESRKRARKKAQIQGAAIELQKHLSSMEEEEQNAK